MAEIDFSAGYRDATKGSTLKALQARRAQMQTRIEEAMKPEPIASAWQGAAHVGGVIGASIREARVANQEASGRERFAKLLAGGLTPDEIGEAMQYDPETTMKFQQHTWDSEAKRTEEENLRARELMKNGWDVAAAAERARVESEAKKADYAHQDTTAETLAGTQEKSAVADDTRAAEAAKADDARAAEAAKLLAGTQETAAVAEDARGEERAVADAKRAAAEAEHNAALDDPRAKLALSLRKGIITPQEYKDGVDAYNAEQAKKAIPAGLDQLNRDTAKEALDWKTVGQSTMASNQVNVAEAIKILETPGIMGETGDALGLGKTGAVAGVLPEGLQAVMNPSGIKARDSIRTAVQSSLKHVLGSQFAATEGEQMLNRAFNMSVNPKDNANRARLIMAQLQQSAVAKDQFVKYYFENNYNMDGYQGPTLEQIQADFKEKTDAIINTTSDDAAAPDAAAPDISTVSEDDLRRIAGGAP